MPKTITLTFGTKEYVVRALTIGQLESLGVGMAAMRRLPEDPVEAERASFENMVDTLVIALSRDDPDMTADKVRSLEADAAQLRASVRAILELSGLIPPDEADKSGEATAASSGAT